MAGEKASGSISPGRPAPVKVPSLDVAIAGGGIVGTALALGLKRAFRSALRVAVFDPAPARPDPRVYAIAAGPRRFLADLGIWSGIAPLAAPIRSMAISDTALGEAVRPTLLTFAGADEDEPFAHIVPAGPLAAALAAAAEEADVAFVPEAVTSFEASASGIAFGDRRTRLLAAADGARSVLRAEAGIPFYGWRYQQNALTATLHHSLPHEGRAVEHFLPGGPFALLPLPEDRSSLVWSDRPEVFARLDLTDGEALLAEINRRAGGVVGRITKAENVAIFPLSMGLARNFRKGRLVLVGDAAHQVHPIAGQGLNIGLADVAALIDAVRDNLKLGLDAGDAAGLETYERRRRFDAAAMAYVTDGLNRLFSNDAPPLRLLRDFGLGLVQRTPAATGFFIAQAAGLGLAPPYSSSRRASSGSMIGMPSRMG